ncbi:hypothetical protein FB565_007543 [Actinoplanes lutulentus]|uniref:AraC family transcriptional regulator n=1 Tax=Actinoplanes lutulentus TaxID=1287878 RepID=UPI000DBA4290|nr:helix-turn-helix domain-containing protein [Actinoplanes lutulentus]MBB2947772.1 hypothetical protein [Actinoplanes lutulentus]
MGLTFTTRDSDSPWIDTVWTCRSSRVDTMTSVATPHWGLVFWQQDGRSFAGVTGPETRAGTAPVPEGADFTGIEFAVGTSLRSVPIESLVDRGLELPGPFVLDGSRWEIPGPDDAEALVSRLVRAGAVVRDPLVSSVLDGSSLDVPARTVSARTVERRFRAATGLTQGAVRQIARARESATLLAGGMPVADVVVSGSYVDEPHLARALRRFVGRTAGELRTGGGGAIALQLTS